MKRFLKSSLSLFLALTIIFSSAYVGLNEVDLEEINFKVVDFGGFNQLVKELVPDLTVKSQAASKSALVFTLSESGKSYSVTDCIVSAKGKLSIPATYKNKPVTGIGDYAFYKCTKLTSIVIPESVKTIGEAAFLRCKSLKSITIPDSVTSIGASAFSRCTKLASITIPDSVSGINDFTFFRCEGLKSIKIPRGVTTIGASAFSRCRALASITIPGTVISIGSSAFYKCTSLATVKIPSSVMSMGDSVFYKCIGLTSVTIPSTIKAISAYAFFKCINLTSVKIPNSVTRIDNDAFSYCRSLTSITIPNSVTSIGSDAFSFCKGLVSISIPESVKKIGEWAFSDCTSLETVVIPDSITRISDYTFSFCTSLKSVRIPKNVTSIGEMAFYACDSFTSFTIPANVTSIGKEAFGYCINLTNIKVNSSNETYSAEDGILFNKDKTKLIKYPEGKTNEKYEIPSSVKTIGDSAFFGCTRLKSITIPKSVTSIGASAFCGCAKLKSVTIPSKVTSIGEWTFFGCEALTSIKIPSNIKSIGRRAFYNCSKLSSVKLNSGLETVGDGAFMNCPKLKKVNIPKSVKTIGAEAFGWIESEELSYPVENFAVCGAKDSAAEKYAKFYDLKFADAFLKAPKLSKISNMSSGIKIIWGKVSGADSYKVYRKTKGGSWKCLGTTTKTYYLDKKAKSNTQYYYAVKAVNQAVTTDLSNTLSIKRLTGLKLSAVSNTSSGIKVSWKKVSGASGYIVYRKAKGGKWKQIGKTSKLYYVDKKAKSGTSYSYAVCAYSGSSKSYYDTDGLSLRRLVAPKISVANKKTGILINWKKVTGASGYYVYRKEGSGKWKKITTLKSNAKIKYLDKKTKKKKTYQYRVTTYYGKSVSANSNTKKIKCKY